MWNVMHSCTSGKEDRRGSREEWVFSVLYQQQLGGTERYVQQ